MPSAVRYNTQSAIRQAKRSGLGIVVKKRVKDIQTDSLVDRTIMGKPVGEDWHYDSLMYVMFFLGAMGSLQVYDAVKNRRVPARSDFVQATVGLGLGAFHFIPATYKIR